MIKSSSAAVLATLGALSVSMYTLHLDLQILGNSFDDAIYVGKLI